MKNSILKIIFALAYFFISSNISSQTLDHSWRDIVESKDDAFFATDSAQAIAENVLLYQRDIGGWPKNKKEHKPLTIAEKAELTDLKSNPNDCTIDNGATYMEMIFLSRVNKYNPDSRYKDAFLKGVGYLLQAQYKNGGWPQFYPLRKNYSSHITFNDDAMEHVMELLYDVAMDNGTFSISADAKTRKECKKAYDKGIECIVNSQYKQNGVLTAWCAQVDEFTLKPTNARAYELPSLSGQESAGLVLVLMNVENPSKQIKEAINSAVVWFEKTKIIGLRIERYYAENGLREKRFIEDPNAKPMWARFMELDDNRPFFSDRDGIKKYSMMEIGQERRNGYGWYSYAPQEVLNKYPDWKAKWEK